MSEYPFLVLSVLFLIPGLLFYALRPDLRRYLRLAVLASLPFGLTEFLFYPTYWEPNTLFNLVPTIGFGIEDLLFVSGLGLIAAACYPVLFGVTVVLPKQLDRTTAMRAVALAGPTVVAVVATAILGIPMIYAAPVIMLLASAVIVAIRTELAPVMAVGATGTVILYTGLSLVYQALIPGVFDLNWNAEAFSNRFILGIPMEELLYGVSAGAVGSVAMVFVLGGSVSRRSQPDAR